MESHKMFKTGQPVVVDFVDVVATVILVAFAVVAVVTVVIRTDGDEVDVVELMTADVDLDVDVEFAIFVVEMDVGTDVHIVVAVAFRDVVTVAFLVDGDVRFVDSVAVVFDKLVCVTSVVSVFV